MSEQPLCDAPILLTGATGYVGGRLLNNLEARCQQVRCLTRRPAALAARVGEHTEVVHGDLRDIESLRAAMEGVRVAYYLVHNLGEANDFVEAELQSARNFAQAAREAGVERIIYLGGLGDDGEKLSPHLWTRHEVGRILKAESGALTIEFRASMIIGSGSLSYELVRALVRRLPFMIAPRWVVVPSQPIAVSDVLKFLIAAVQVDLPESEVFEIGGRDQMSYRDVFYEYSRQRGVRRWIVIVPVLTPRLSSYWLHLVTPIYARVGRKLIESTTHATVVNNPRAFDVFGVHPMSVSEAIRLAIRKEDRDFAQTHWSDALSAFGPERRYGGVRFGQRLVDHRKVESTASPEAVFAAVEAIGGRRGWYYGNWLWWLRGAMDRIVGGVGMGRGRRDAKRLRTGEVLDCWRVETVERPRRLRLFAEMKMPGRAWLEFEVLPGNEGGSTLYQTAIFDPKGVLGPLYWYSLYLLHELIFAGMARNLVRHAEQNPEVAAIAQDASTAG